MWNHQRAGSSPPSPQSEDTNTVCLRCGHPVKNSFSRGHRKHKDWLGLTGARPGHSYTVKSPSSFSSSVDAPESGTLGSFLQEVTVRGQTR